MTKHEELAKNETEERSTDVSNGNGNGNGMLTGWGKPTGAAGAVGLILYALGQGGIFSQDATEAAVKSEVRLVNIETELKGINDKLGDLSRRDEQVLTRSEFQIWLMQMDRMNGDVIKVPELYPHR